MKCQKRCTARTAKNRVCKLCATGGAAKCHVHMRQQPKKAFQKASKKAQKKKSSVSKPRASTRRSQRRSSKRRTSRSAKVAEDEYACTAPYHPNEGMATRVKSCIKGGKPMAGYESLPRNRQGCIEKCHF